MSKKKTENPWGPIIFDDDGPTSDDPIMKMMEQYEKIKKEKIERWYTKDDKSIKGATERRKVELQKLDAKIRDAIYKKRERKMVFF